MLTYTRTLIIAFSALLCSHSAFAEDSSTEILSVDTKFQQHMQSSDIKLNLKRSSEKLLPPGLYADPDSKDMAVDKPTCDNHRLVKKVMAYIDEYYQQKSSRGQLDKRKQMLTLKNLNHFIEEDMDKIDSKKNFYLAGRITTHKINHGFEKKDMRLCRSVSSIPIYLLIYPYDSVYKVEIINFPGRLDSENFTTIYD